MKRTIFIIFYTLTTFILLHAQDGVVKPVSRKIGIVFSSFGENVVFSGTSLDGAASYDGDGFYTLGVNYMYGLNRWLEFETGVEYSKLHIIVNPNLPPDIDAFPRKESFSLITIPIALRANFLKYFFINGGAIVDVDTSFDGPIDTQTGLGSLFGLGIKHDFDKGISVFANHYFKVHSLIPFTFSDNHQRIWENGFRFGVSYDLKK